VIWSLTVSIGTISRTDLAYKQWIFLFIHIYSVECFLSLGVAT
jgi:hypothetical protein